MLPISLSKNTTQKTKKMNENEKNTTLNTMENIEIWDNSKRAKNLIIVFWILIGLNAIGIISGYLELEILKNLQLGILVDDSTANANDMRQMVIGLLQTGLFIASIVVFLNWFRRSYGNLHRLGLKYLDHSESMAVWAWFIPLIVFFRPVQIMYEIWTETQEKIKKMDSTYVIKNGLLIIGLWWALFIISNFVGRYVLKTAFKDETLEQLIESSQAILISDILQIPEALLVILIVYQLSKMESKLAEEVKKSGGHIVYK